MPPQLIKRDMDPTGSVGAFKCAVKLWDWTMSFVTTIILREKQKQTDA